MKRTATSDDDLAAAPAASAAADARGKKRRLRRGRRKSKAERLARAVAPSAGSSDGTSASLEALQQLLDGPKSNTSNEWDLAQNMALRLDSPEARACMVQSLLWGKSAPKAAAHYAKRLRMSEPEALEVLERGRSPSSGVPSSHGEALAVTKFLVEVGEDVVSTSERLNRFLWPWLERSRQRLPLSTAAKANKAAGDADMETPGSDTADPAVVAAKRERSEFRAAVRLLLHPLPAADLAPSIRDVSMKPSKAPAVADKRARSEALHRLLVRECLDHGRFLYLVPTYAASGFSSVAPPLLERHVCSSTGHQQSSISTPSNSLETRRLLATRIEQVLRMIWPDCYVVVFGSSATGLLLPAAAASAPDELDASAMESGDSKKEEDDLDLCVVVPSSPVVRRATAPLAVEMKEHLALYLPDLRDLMAIEGARIPIAMGVDSNTGVKCEMSVNNVSAIWNTRLITWLLTRGVEVAATNTANASTSHLADTIRRFCLWLKHWRRVKKRTAGVSLSSYGLLILALYFLQQQGLMPAVDCSKAAAASEEALGSFSVEAVDQFFADMPCPATKSVRDGANDLKVCWWTLVQRFFRFYTTEFDYENVVVSLRTTAVVTKAHKRWTRVAWKAVISIEDPVEVTRDLGMLFTRKTFGKLRCAFAHACSTFFFSPSDSVAEDQEAALLASHPFEITHDSERGRRSGDPDAEEDGDEVDSDDGDDHSGAHVE